MLYYHSSDKILNELCTANNLFEITFFIINSEKQSLTVMINDINRIEVIRLIQQVYKPFRK